MEIMLEEEECIYYQIICYDGCINLGWIYGWKIEWVGESEWSTLDYWLFLISGVDISQVQCEECIREWCLWPGGKDWSCCIRGWMHHAESWGLCPLQAARSDVEHGSPGGVHGDGLRSRSCLSLPALTSTRRQ
jgi:hypothetical protein